MSLPSEGSHRYDQATALIAYEGWAIRKGADVAGGVWKLRRITFNANGNLIKIEWADGNELYDQKWDDRATTVVYS